MRNIKFNLFPGGLCKCITMSYDDGVIEDIRLAEIFRKNGIKGTFHINSNKIGKPGEDAANNIPEVYRGHEVSCHMVTHPFPTDIPDTNIVSETVEDRRALEEACGYVVRGMSYPFGNFDDRVIDIIKKCGIEYSRTVFSTRNFEVPEDFLRWNPTVHHTNNLDDFLTKFLDLKIGRRPHLFYVWGHSYEFDRANNWELIENFCERAGGRDDIWYATNIEIVDYISAIRSLRVSVKGDKIYNPSAQTVWFSLDDKPVKVESGETLCF